MADPDTSPPTGRAALETPTFHIPFITALVFAVSMFKGLRMPSLWAATHMTFNYSQGFLRRGLFGQVLRIFGEERIYRYNFLFLCAVVLFVLAAIALLLLIRRMFAGERGDRGLQAATLVLAASPGMVFLVHEIGYLDYMGIVAVPLFVLWAARSRRLFLVFYVAIPISIILALIHESMIVMFAPAMLFTLVCHITTRGTGLPRRTRVLLVGQFRYTMDHYSWEIPEGGGDFDEFPEAAARRELAEETGYVDGEWRELCRAELSNSVTDEVTVLFVATDLQSGPASPEGTEQLQLRWVAFDEVMAMIAGGEIVDAMTILAMQQLALERVTRRG